VFKVSIEIKPTQAPGWRTGQDKAHTITLLPYNSLDPGGVEHDAAAAAHRLGGQVARELGANGALGAVSPGDAAPDGPELGPLDLLGGLVDVAHTLPQVEVDVLLVLEPLDRDQRGVLILIAHAAHEPQDRPLDIKPGGLLLPSLVLHSLRHCRLLLRNNRSRKSL